MMSAQMLANAAVEIGELAAEGHAQRCRFAAGGNGGEKGIESRAGFWWSVQQKVDPAPGIAVSVTIHLRQRGLVFQFLQLADRAEPECPLQFPTMRVSVEPAIDWDLEVLGESFIQPHRDIW
jgi:hypothetical protein